MVFTRKMMMAQLEQHHSQERPALSSPVTPAPERKEAHLSYYPHTSPSKIGRAATPGKRLREASMGVDPPLHAVQGSSSSSTANLGHVRVQKDYGKCAKHEGFVWFYKRDKVSEQTLQGNTGGGDMLAYWLPKMLEVKSPGRGGLIDPAKTLGDNASVILSHIDELTPESHQLEMPWKHVVGPGGGNAESHDEWREWECSEYSKHKVDTSPSGNKDVHRFADHRKGGYLKVLLGYSSNKYTPVYEYAHRLVLWAFCGPPFAAMDGGGESMMTLHACNRRACLCVAHLRWGTSTENNQQMHAAKREKQQETKRKKRQRAPVRRHLFA